MYDEGKEAREERARCHSARVAILGLLARDSRGLSPPQIKAELPGEPTLRNVYYHLQILKASRLVVEDEGTYKLP